MRWNIALMMFCSSLLGKPITLMEHFEPEQWTHVSVDEKRIKACAARFSDGSALCLPQWKEVLPPGLDQEEKVNFLMGLVAIDFCHWGLDGERRYDYYSIDLKGNRVRGSMAMMTLLKKLYIAGYKIFEAPEMASVTAEQLGPLLQGFNETGRIVDIPWLKQRVEILNDIGSILIEKWGGSFSNLFLSSKGRVFNEGEGFIELLVSHFPRYRDAELYRGKEVGFYKLAQLSVIALQNGLDAPSFVDCEALTLCPDYQIPRCLHALGILHYDELLEAKIRQGELLPKGSEFEVELRMATVYAGWQFKEEINRIRKDSPITSQELDFLLWSQGRKHGRKDKHHLTLTTMY